MPDGSASNIAPILSHTYRNTQHFSLTQRDCDVIACLIRVHRIQLTPRSNTLRMSQVANPGGCA
eukprot:scaffold8451_cov128-Isochrysis_galbana.AAC.2